VILIITLNLYVKHFHSFVIEKIMKILKYINKKLVHVICCSITNNYQLDIQESTQVCLTSIVDSQTLTQ